MSVVADRIGRVEESIEAAVRAVESDAGASPVLAAVVREFERKLRKAHGSVDAGDPILVREAVVELEQAGDSAKAAAEADAGLSEQARAAVLAAHEAICVLKAKMG